MTTDSIIPEADSAHAKQEVPHAQFARQYCADHNLPHDYYSVSRPEKSAILDAAQHATGYHRKSLIRLFRRLIALAREAVLGITRKVKKVGRPAKYLPESGDVVRSLAERMGVSERKIAGAIPRWIPVAAKLAPAHLRDRVVQDLRSMSSATFGRLLRKDGATRSHSPRKPRPRSRHQLATPLRTWDDWADVRPGEMQVDSVAHAGGRGGGGHAWTVTVIDVFSGWTDAEAIAKLTKENVAAGRGRRAGCKRPRGFARRRSGNTWCPVRCKSTPCFTTAAARLSRTSTRSLPWIHSAGGRPRRRLAVSGGGTSSRRSTGSRGRLRSPGSPCTVTMAQNF